MPVFSSLSMYDVINRLRTLTLSPGSQALCHLCTCRFYRSLSEPMLPMYVGVSPFRRVGVKLRRRFQNLPKMRKTGCRGNRHDAIQRETARCILLRRRTPGIIDDVNSLRRCRWLTGSRTVLKKLTRNLAKCADWRSRELAEADATSASFNCAELREVEKTSAPLRAKPTLNEASKS